MGAPTLKIKEELDYRFGRAKEKCLYCRFFHMTLPEISGSRCEIMGLQPGRAYRITYNNLCDRYEQRA